MKCITLSSGKQVCFDSTPKAQTGRYNIPVSKERQLAEQARMQGDIAAQNKVLPKEAVKVNAIAKEKIKQQQERKAQEDFYNKGRTELNEGKADVRSALERKLDNLNLGFDQLEQQGNLAPGFRDFQNMGGLDKALFLMGSAFEPMGGGKAGFVKNGKFISVEPNQINTYMNSGKLGQTASKAIQLVPRLVKNAYKINPLATKLEDVSNKTFGKGSEAFIFDPSKSFGKQLYSANPHSLMGYKPIKNRSTLNVEPFLKKLKSDFIKESLKHRMNLTNSNDNDIDNLNLEQFLDFYKSLQKQKGVFYDKQRTFLNFANELRRDKNTKLPYENSLHDKFNNDVSNLQDRMVQHMLKTIKSSNSPLGTLRGQGGEGFVFELKADPNKVIKFGQNFDHRSYENANDIVKSYKGLPRENVAVIDRAFLSPDKNYMVSVMPNIKDKKFGTSFGFLSNDDQTKVIKKFEDDIKKIYDLGFYIDVYNPANIDFNTNLQRMNFYDLGRDYFSAHAPNSESAIRVLKQRINNNEFKKGGNINTTGYLDNSDTKHNPYNIIPSNNITMDGVSIPLMLMPDGDQARVVMPNSGEYNFPNSQYVTEIPLAQKGRVNYPQPTTHDSVLLYNNQLLKDSFYRNNPNYKRLLYTGTSNKDLPDIIKSLDPNTLKEIINEASIGIIPENYATTFNKPRNKYKSELEKKFKRVSNNVYSAGDIIGGELDTWFNPDAPPSYFSPTIKPKNWIAYQSEKYSDITEVPMYDPLAIKPFHMRTPQERIEWEKKYGKPQEKPIERTTLEPVESKSVPMLESNFEPTPITPMSVDRPMMQPSNEEYNRQYSITIPTVEINKRQVAPRVNRVLGQNRVNPKNQYQRSIDVDTRQLPIMDEYTLNKLRMKLGMNPKGFQTGGQAVKKGPGPFLIPESRPQFKSMPVPNRQDPRFMAYQDSVIQNNKSIQALQDFNKAYNAKQPYVATPENLTDDYKNSGVKQQAKYTNPKNTKNYLQPSKKIDDLNEEQRANLIEAFDTQQEGTPTNLPTALYYGDMFNNSTYRNEDIWFDYHTNPVQPYHVEPMELIQSKTPGPLSTSFERPAPSVPQITPYTPTGKGFSPKTEGLTVPVPTIEVSREVAPPRSNQLFRKNVVNPKQRVKTNVKVDIDQREIMDRAKLDSLRESMGLEPKGYQKGGKTDDATFKKFVATLPPNLRNTGSDYNLRGYWESLGKPSAFDYSQPKESDGMYHAYSRNSETGEILKKPNHPTFGQALEEDRKLGYYPYQSSTGVMHTFKPNEVPQGFNVPIYPTLNNIKKQSGGKNTKTIKLSSGKIITFK